VHDPLRPLPGADQSSATTGFQEQWGASWQSASNYTSSLSLPRLRTTRLLTSSALLRCSCSASPPATRWMRPRASRSGDGRRQPGHVAHRRTRAVRHAVGTIFEAYRDQRIVRDDAVVVCTALPEVDDRPLTLAPVDMEAALLAPAVPEGRPQRPLAAFYRAILEKPARGPLSALLRAPSHALLA